MFYILGGILFIVFLLLSERAISKFVNFILYGSFLKPYKS